MWGNYALYQSCKIIGLIEMLGSNTLSLATPTTD